MAVWGPVDLELESESDDCDRLESRFGYLLDGSVFGVGWLCFFSHAADGRAVRLCGTQKSYSIDARISVPNCRIITSGAFCGFL